MSSEIRELREAIAQACRNAGYDQAGALADAFWVEVDNALVKVARLESENKRLREEKADDDLAFNHANEAVQKYMADADRLQAYADWLVEGYKSIANGTLSQEARDDLYRTYARDTLGGPTKQTLDEFIAARSALAGK